MALAVVLGGCQTALPHGTAAYALVPPSPAGVAAPVARALQPGDTIAVQVYREPGLGGDKLVLDEVGEVQLPLLGEVAAAGHTPGELARLIEARLGARYLRDPQVTVALVETAVHAVTVEGQVKAPGVFPVSRGETLLSSIARAGSPVQTARLREVVVFRTVNGQRTGAVFDLVAIRTGQAPDPQILDGDTVVVGFSAVKGAYRDFLAAAPLLGLFTVF